MAVHPCRPALHVWPSFHVSKIFAAKSISADKSENEVLTSLSKGNSYKLIAEEIFISLDTVRTHIRNIYEKLHVHSQTEAVAKAINEKLL